MAIEAAWKEVLFNQFHDILPGTAITPVYTEANERWEKAIVSGNRILEMGLRQITVNIAIPKPPHLSREKTIQYIIFNSLNHSRETIVIFSWEKLAADWQSLTDANCNNSFFEFNFSARYLYNSAEEKNNIPSGYTYRVCDDLGRKIKTQNTRLGLAVFVSGIPSIGYRSIFVNREENKPTNSQISTVANSAKEFILENEIVRIEISPKEGTILSYYHKHLKKELLKSPSNQLLTFIDSGQYWDAWNIDPNYREHPLPAPKIESIQWDDRGEIYSTIRVTQTIENSTWIQDYTLFHHSGELTISTRVKNWQTRHRLVKARFDFNLDTTFATYEIPCGAIERSTQPQTTADRAKWEVPGLRWADLTDISQTWGISLIDDSKYGYSTPQPSTLELTLLRAPKWPDPEADRGDSHFTYTLYPHLGSWQTANIVAAARNLNSPLTITTPSPITTPQLPPSQSLLSIDADNFIPTAFKPNRHHPGSFILRGYESTGKSANISISNPLGLKLAASLNLLESPNDNPSTHTVTPWQIATWQVNIEE
jgi:alpha-mannosidase